MTQVDFACNNTDFEILCDLIMTSNSTQEALSDGTGNWTIFAPTDAAFGKFEDVLFDNCTAPLDSILGFHAVDGDVLFSTDLVCSGIVEMSNGDESRTVCHGGKIYQKGQLNSVENMPEIVTADIEACDGVIHVVDDVLLPKPHFLSLENCDTEEVSAEESSCSTIAELVCGDSAYSIICDLVTEYNMVDTLSVGVWTLFVPTDDAFEALSDAMGMDMDTLTPDQIIGILMFHAHMGSALTFDDLECTQPIPMINGKMSRTKCTDDGAIKYVVGPGQMIDMLPEIIVKDVEACNGIIQVVNHVIMPALN